MTTLDNPETVKSLDKSNVLGSVEALPDQFEHAWEEANKVTVPDTYRDIDNLVMTGMGGSGLGARLIQSVYGMELTVPLVRINDYDLPGFVNQKTLVICSSYSGTTEETIENARQAVDKGARWMAIGTGAELIDLARQHQVPFYQIDPKHNPSNQPRMAIGYSVVGQLAMVAKTGIFQLSHEAIAQAIVTMRQVQAQVNPQVPESKNPAKQLAQKMFNKIILYIAARHLTGAIHTVKNQLSENAKALSARFDIPELNHFMMEGLKHPAMNKTDTLAFFADSRLYPERIQKRLKLTKDVVEKNEIATYLWQAQAESKLSQAFELIQFGAYVNFYLSMLYGIDPAPIPWVDYFKEQLKK
jgi:glucose/mannose-6-phosphate isomerase